MKAYADPVGELINSYIPHGAHGDMDRYLYDPLYHYSENAGKRHRPLICFAACLAVGGDPDRAATAAAAIEHFHSAALIHDDIADEAELRRGEPCLHLTEGLGLAINMGDLALSMVNGPVVNDPLLEDAVKVRVIKELIAMTCRTVEGQALDLGWARDGRYDITPEDYLTMAIHKTAHYSGAVPLAVGAIVGGADDEIVEALRSYGSGHGPRLPNPGRSAEPRGHRRGQEEGLPQRHHRGQAHAGRGARPAERGARGARASRRDPVVEGARPGGARRGRGHHGGERGRSITPAPLPRI